MRFSTRLVLVSFLIGSAIEATPAKAQEIVTLGSGFFQPEGVAVDSSGNVFVGDTNNAAVKEIVAAGGYQTVTTLPGGSGSIEPFGVAVDGSGNVFVVDNGNNAVKEIPAAGGYQTIVTISSGLNYPFGVAVDGSGNVFVTDSDNNAVKEFIASSGYATVTTLGSGFSFPRGIAVDGSGNVFVADSGNSAVKEILAAGGYSSVTVLGSGFSNPSGVAVDASGNVFVADPQSGTVNEVLAAGGYTTVNTLGSGFIQPYGVAVDGTGDVFVVDPGNSTVKEILAAPPTVVASVLPGSRSVQLGNAATIFATMINAGSAALSNCAISLPASAPSGLSLTYQTTDPETNALMGTPNTPVTIPGNDGVQTFVLSFTGTTEFSAPGMPLDFGCTSGNVTNAAAVVPGIDTVDLLMSETPIADIIALSATPTNNGIIEVPSGGSAAFAVASDNVGATAPIIVSVDTGTVVLPVTATVCQSNPSNGQCLAPPAATVSLNYAAGATPTFSIFLQATGSIAFAPATARVFVRFEDDGGGLHGSTSVAIETL